MVADINDKENVCVRRYCSVLFRGEKKLIGYVFWNVMYSEDYCFRL